LSGLFLADRDPHFTRVLAAASVWATGGLAQPDGEPDA